VLVESAIVAPLLILLLIGIMEMGSLLRSYSTAANAARAAGRAASIAGADPMADRMILARLEQESSGGMPGQIAYVVVWHAAGPGEEVPEACIPTSTEIPNLASVGVSDGGVDALGACNVYVRPEAPGGAFDLVAEAAQGPNPSFGCQGLDDPEAEAMVDCSWPAKNRRAVTTPRDSVGPIVPPDFIGVHVEVEHHYFTHIVGSSQAISETAINLIEPQGYEFS
jgi:hypothetical protein